jgi:hypothetical protein
LSAAARDRQRSLASLEKNGHPLERGGELWIHEILVVGVKLKLILAPLGVGGGRFEERWMIFLAEVRNIIERPAAGQACL